MASTPLYAAPHIAARLPNAVGRLINRLIQITDLGNAIWQSNGQTWFPITDASFPNGLPTASAQYAGVRAFVPGASGAADTYVICLKAAGGTYSWKTIVTG